MARTLAQYVWDSCAPVFRNILEESAHNCPLDSGATRSSGMVSINGNKVFTVQANSGGNVSVLEEKVRLGNVPMLEISIEYDRPLQRKGYVLQLEIWLHENLTYTPTRTGGPKFLENAITAHAQKIHESIAQGIENYLVSLDKMDFSLIFAE